MLASSALRRGPGGGLLVQLGGPLPRRRRPVLWRRAVLRRAAVLTAQVPAGWVVCGDGGVVRVWVPQEQAGDPGVGALITSYPGPVAVAVEVPRDDGVDGVLRIVDEILLVDQPIAAVNELALDELRALGPVDVVQAAPARRRRPATADQPSAARTPSALFG
ncbi:MAG: hypothetical protein GX856_04840, partial [Gammaproteobacteria bacterium]|nr:hypothetical protein [Gammaproteobacteria bacterium]